MRKIYDSNQFLFWIILPAAIISVIAHVISENNNYSTNDFLIALSSLCPILGFICYFARRDEDSDAANMYLGCAIASFMVWFLILIIL